MTTKIKKAVLISDTHFSLKTLEVASQAYIQALDYAKKHDLPFIDCGDLTNDKAVLRGEVVNQLLHIFSKYPTVKKYLLVGNHSLLNEKSKEHVLHFLQPHAMIIDKPYYDKKLNLGFIPYNADKEETKKQVLLFKPTTTLIMHTGFIGAYMGEYIKDDSSLDPKDFDTYKIISGHYHKRQNLNNIFYVGNPYTLSFAEANDGPKGYVVLNSDQSLDFIPTNLRRHVVLDLDVEKLVDFVNTVQNDAPTVYDIILVKLKGPEKKLKQITKDSLGHKLFGHTNFKLELHATDKKIDYINKHTKTLSNVEIFDTLISEHCNDVKKADELKKLWRNLINDN